MIKIQPEPFVDNLVDGHELTKLPYPFFVDEDGLIAQQDLWQGDPFKVVGFQLDLAVQKIDLWWTDVVANPEIAVGMYLVTADKSGDYGVHSSAIRSLTVLV